MNESKILLVDDQTINLKLLNEMLANQEYTFSFAKNGKKALELVSATRPDLILLDIMMPEMDGWEVLKKLKKDKLYRDIPVIVQTVLESPEDFERGLSLGAYYYITKPIDQNILLPLVKSALEEYRNIRLLKKELEEADEVLALTEEWKLRFHTLQQATSLSKLASKVCPDPAKALVGILELLTNAVEHGIAEIDYDEKSELNLKGCWEDEVLKRLELPENRKKSAKFLIRRDDRRISIRIEDPGPGFEWKNYLNFSIDRATDSHGRGIAMANTLSFDSMEYSEQGNVVTVTIDF
jgi:CheY-like chemotaxis protein/anti-sigma regulatory factor (Ser/Thr protein kinase)